MNLVVRYAPVAALGFGPSTAYLVWAITRRKPIHTFVAATITAGLWIGGPVFLTWVASYAL